MEAPRDITVPVGSTQTLRAILSAALRRLLNDLGRVGRTSPEVLRGLRAQLADSPGPAFAALRRPNVGVLVRTLRERGPDAALAARLGPTLVAELWAAGGTLPALTFESPSVACLGAGRVLPGGAVTIADDYDAVRGVFTDGDLRRSLQEHGSGVVRKTLSELGFTEEPITIDADSLLYDAMSLFEQSHVDTIIVVDDGKPVGIIDIQDIVSKDLFGG